VPQCLTYTSQDRALKGRGAPHQALLNTADDTHTAMSAVHYGEGRQLGATYAPGTDDSYGMPGILSPGLPLPYT